jgi:hypothetical protein
MCPRETCVAVPYHTWEIPSATLPHPVWRDVQPGFSAGALAGVYLDKLPHRKEIWEIGAEPQCTLNFEVTSITI